jgi:GTP cyclohydrolase I
MVPPIAPPTAPPDREAAAKAIDMFLRALGRSPDREPELAGTGARVADAFADDLLAGYDVDVDALLAQNVFEGRSGVVVVRDIPLATMCPHHLLPASGVAAVAFAPDRRLVGFGTVAAVVDAYARRLALQEQIGENVASALQKHLAPRWVVCRLTMSHACMTLRGERAHGASVETAAHRRSPDIDEAILHAALR